MSDAERATPLVDRYIVDPMLVPPGFSEWARGVETLAREARGALLKTDPAVAGEHLAVIRGSLTELDAILDDSSAGLLRRVLSRPPWQLGPDSPARSSLERRLKMSVATAREAADVSGRVRRISDRLGSFRDRYGERYPAVTAGLLEKARLRDVDLLALRREVEVSAVERRLARVEQEMAARDEAIQEVNLSPATWTLAEDETGAPFELAASCALALRERTRRNRRRLREGVTATALSSHLSSIDPSTNPDPGKSSSGHGYLIEDVLRRTIRVGSQVRLRGADAPLWSAALATAVDSSRLYSVQLPATSSEAPEDGEQDGEDRSYYFVPLGDDLVLISQSQRSAIRLWSARLALGKEADGQVIADAVGGSDGDAAADIAQLFGGTRPVTAWYKTHGRVKVQIVAHTGDAWLGRISRRGILHRGTTDGWQPLANEPSEFRIVVRGGPAPVEPPLAPDFVAARNGVPVGNPFAGFSTAEVSTSLGDDLLAWRRNPSNRGSAGMRALETEWELFSKMARGSRRAARALEPLVWTLGSGMRTRFPLYRMPLAVLPSAPHFDSLIALNLSWRLFTIREIAKCLRVVHGLGYSLGTVHLSQFVFAVEPNGPNHLAVPRPILAYAPGTTRLGEEPVVDMRLEHDEIRYEKLRTPLLNPLVAARKPADVGQDIFSFGVVALDVLAKAPIAAGTVFYADLRDCVRANPERFAEPALASRLADALVGGEAVPWLGKLFARLSAGLALTADAWISN